MVIITDMCFQCVKIYNYGLNGCIHDHTAIPVVYFVLLEKSKDYRVDNFNHTTSIQWNM